ncbi:L-serine ammonia-lyase [Devosia sp.]|uniref:L-serine ammonia-lyase n=1 Tax=Devosia sp. TaxID=1871048 RepID=UPI001AC4FCE8|nr:L-serine ammonia-lyase [Devosia sp.]MBN9309145.1 L-serine ammonia-lyase [Devosia sp.]
MFLSVFDVFKIGIGPSSSHTMGPMTAANRFLDEILAGDWPRPRQATVAALKVSLHGSLAFTGVGHGTGRAVVLGLCGLAPDSVDPDRTDATIAAVEAEGLVHPPGHPAYRFRPAHDLVYDRSNRLPGHANGLQFFALDADGTLLLRRIYYSIGGGFVVSEAELARGPAAAEAAVVPYPFENAAQMLEMAASSGLSIAQMKRANEEARIGRKALDAGLDRIWEAMDGCIRRGLATDGQLPGDLKVNRRARAIHTQLEQQWQRNELGPFAGNDWLGVYAMAVNEENAAGGRVVTAPTNGAAGVIPAVLKHHATFATGATRASIRDMLLTAAAIGGIIKHNASISGAEVGCQGEVGSASAMAAAALCAAMGGTPAQVENAAEIALEHHLGMTCDPVAGLVQIPCIERNAFGAVKAVTAASLALKGDGTHKVSLDVCVETMRQTGHDMSERYKETSQAGLAVNVVAC